MSDNNRNDVFDIPRGKLVGYNGPGSLYVNTEGISFMLSAVDKWYNSKKEIDLESFKIHDKRLEKILHVSHFKEVPAYRDPESVENIVNSGIRIPVIRYPLLHYCNECGMLSTFKEGDFTKTKHCTNCNIRREFVQFPIVIVCKNGHMEDFPYLQFVHPLEKNIDKHNHAVKVDRYRSSSILNWTLKCSCGKKHSLTGITGQSPDETSPTPFQKEMKNHNLTCSGDRPWSGEKNSDNCSCKPSAILKNSLSIYQPETIPVLSLTGEKNLKDYSNYEDILRDEFQKLTLRESEIDSNKLKVENSFTSTNSSVIKSVNYVRRLQEIIVQTDFTRLTSLEENESVDKVANDRNNSMLFSKDSYHDWYPAKKQYGEGIFIEFNTNILSDWEQVKAVKEKYKLLKDRVDSYYEIDKFSSPAHILIHTLSHSLIHELSALSGYTMTAIREKLYFKENNLGLLIYVTDSDKDGTFGGLVRLAEEKEFKRIFNQALKSMEWCSSDPVCFELGKNSGQGLGNTNGAACHNCSFVPSTSCPHRNCYLDRDFVGRSDAPECITYGHKYKWFNDGLSIKIVDEGDDFNYDSWEEANAFEQSDYYRNNNMGLPESMGGTIELNDQEFEMKYYFKKNKVLVLYKNQDIDKSFIGKLDEWEIIIEK